MTQQGETLCFRRPHGAEAKAVVTECRDDPLPAGPPLRAWRLTLEYADGAREEVRQVVPADSGPGGGYDALDNEILAGLRLGRLCETRPHPPAVSRLVGYEPDGVRPYALLEPYRGRPAGAGGKILPGERRLFQESLLTGLRWLGAAGVAHRSISPYTVHWDGSDVQITDFTAATLVGAPRSAGGTPPWQAPEQRPDQVTGTVTDKDDVWAAGRLIFYVTTGRELAGARQLDEEPELARLLDGVFGPMDGRPSVRDLLGRIGAADPVPRVPGPGPEFQRGRADFFALRAHKHPDTAPRREREREQEPPRPAVPARLEPDRPRRLWRRGR